AQSGSSHPEHTVTLNPNPLLEILIAEYLTDKTLLNSLEHTKIHVAQFIHLSWFFTISLIGIFYQIVKP
ncbi:MAG: hypothetical protein QXM89_04850, partial [Candidatus Bathyarchaeia archaeon]